MLSSVSRKYKEGKIEHTTEVRKTNQETPEGIIASGVQAFSFNDVGAIKTSSVKRRGGETRTYHRNTS
jgi:hypothetical protein